MASRARYRSRPDDEEELDRRGPRRRQQSTTSVLIPAAVLLGMIGGAIVLARAIASKKDDQAAVAEEKAPEQQFFTSVPDEAPPTATGGRAPSALPRAPSGLADSNPDWKKALEIAAVADELFAEAQKAKAAQDHSEWQLKGKAAKETYDEAILLTAEWEEELLEEYGERDPQVRDIQRTRNRWIDRLRVLHKTTGR